MRASQDHPAPQRTECPGDGEDLARTSIHTDPSVAARPSDPCATPERAPRDLQQTFEQRLRERTGELHSTIHRLQAEIERHRAAEASLSEREERYRVLYEQNPSMYFTLDPSGLILSVNQFGASALGYHPHELINQSVLRVFDPADHHTVLGQLRICSGSPETTFDWEIEKVRKNGSRLWVKERARCITDPQGSPMILVVCEDITDRREAEQNVRESENRLRAFALAIPDLAFVLDEQGRYVEILGSRDELLYADASWLEGRLLHDVFPQAEADFFLAVIRKTVATGRSQHVEYPLKVKAGMRWFEGHTSPMQPVPDKVRQIVWVAHDITDRKQAEEALRVSEERFAKAFRSSPHPIIVTERDTGRCLEVNDAGLALFGYRRDEVIGQTVLTLGLWPTSDERTGFFARLAAEGTLRNMEQRFYAKDRTPRHCLVSCEPIELNGTPCLVTVGTDITEQKRATEALHLSEQYLKSIIETSPECVKLLAADGTLLTMNAAGLAMIEADRAEEALGRNAYMLIAPEYREAFQAMNERVCRGNKEILEYEIVGLRGTRRWMETHAVPLHNPSDGRMLQLAITRDITARKRAEEALHRQERTLQQARDERERISQDLHDNILQSLYAVGMQLEASKIVASTSARKAKTHITRAIGQLNHLVLDVRHFIALLHKRNTLELDFGMALRQLAASFSSAGNAAPALDIDQTAISLIRPDVGEQLLSIAREALSNSVRHAEATHRSITLRLTGPSIHLCIGDDGIGFTTTKKRRRGHGLANMARRARQIGATFALASASGQGTRVTVEMPLERSHEHGTI